MLQILTIFTHFSTLSTEDPQQSTKNISEPSKTPLLVEESVNNLEEQQPAENNNEFSVPDFLRRRKRGNDISLSVNHSQEQQPTPTPNRSQMPIPGSTSHLEEQKLPNNNPPVPLPRSNNSLKESTPDKQEQYSTIFKQENSQTPEQYVASEGNSLSNNLKSFGKALISFANGIVEALNNKLTERNNRRRDMQSFLIQGTTNRILDHPNFGKSTENGARYFQNNSYQIARNSDNDLSIIANDGWGEIYRHTANQGVLIDKIQAKDVAYFEQAAQNLDRFAPTLSHSKKTFQDKTQVQEIER